MINRQTRRLLKEFEMHLSQIYLAPSALTFQHSDFFPWAVGPGFYISRLWRLFACSLIY